MRLLGKALLFLLLLCPTATAVRAADPPSAAADSLRQGIELYRAGRTEEALTALRSFVVRNSDSPLLPQAHLYLARLFVAGGQAAEALHYLNRTAEKDLLPEMRLLKGAALVQSGEAAAGLVILIAQEPEKLTVADRLLRLTWLAHGHTALGRPLPALTALQDALTLSATEAAKLQEQARTVLSALSASELDEAVSRFSGTAIGAEASLQKAERALAAGDLAQAQQVAVAVAEGGLPAAHRQAALLFLERLAARSRPERAIGVILPLSGRFAPFGAQVRRGMELAREARGDDSIRFVFVDGAGEAEKSAEAVSELVVRERVMAIAGPLTGAAAAAAAARAEKEQVPLLTLSQREGLPEQGGFVFRESLTPRLQVQALVNHAMGEQKLTDFAILSPENKLGREMAELFAREVTSRGGTITDRQSYPENVTDFRRQVRLLQRRDPAVPDGDEPVAAKVHFQALFIPDYAERIGLIAPQLVFYGIDGVRLLGISGWNSPDLLRLAGKFVEGAFFVDGFHAASLNPAVRDFVRLFTEKYGEEPTILDAQGFDAAGILLSLLSDPAVASRDDLRQALAGLRDYRGATGKVSFTPQGEAEKSLFLLRVQGGAIVEVN